MLAAFKVWEYQYVSRAPQLGEGVHPRQDPLHDRRIGLHLAVDL